MPQSRYLFALSCYRMDLVKEAEAALYPPNEPNSEVLTFLYYAEKCILFATTIMASRTDA